MKNLKFIPWDNDTQESKWMRYLNKKRARKSWTLVEFESFARVYEVDAWCRTNRENNSRWYHQARSRSFYFEDSEVAMFVQLRFR